MEKRSFSKEELNTEITDLDRLQAGFVLRSGFVFVLGDRPSVFDTLLIRWPEDATAVGLHGVSARTLEEHIALIRCHQLEKAEIVCRDLSFITQCPSLKEVGVYPDDGCGDGFDYAPLYQMPQLRRVNCRTVYGLQTQYRTCVDYTKMKGVVDIAAAGPGHMGYERVPGLETLWVSGSKEHKDLSDLSCSERLTDITMMQCGLQTLDGIEKHGALQSLELSYNRSLRDISALSSVGTSLRLLVIESCPKITDFSVMDELTNLEHLQLYGSNTLPDLGFLENMKKLKTFTFTMDVAEGDLSLCRTIPYASCRNRKHFNLKDEQLPKRLAEV